MADGGYSDSTLLCAVNVKERNDEEVAVGLGGQAVWAEKSWQEGACGRNDSHSARKLTWEPALEPKGGDCYRFKRSRNRSFNFAWWDRCPLKYPGMRGTSFVSDSRGVWKAPLWVLGNAEAKGIEVCTGDPQEEKKATCGRWWPALLITASYQAQLVSAKSCREKHRPTELWQNWIVVHKGKLFFSLPNAKTLSVWFQKQKYRWIKKYSEKLGLYFSSLYRHAVHCYQTFR